MTRDPTDHKGRINRSQQAKFAYLTSVDEADLFDENDVTYYWDLMEGLPEQEALNFLCAEWQPFIRICNPSSFARSWGADCRGWPGANGFNSAGLFGSFLAQGLSVEQLFEILFEMARVRQNDWARQMITGFIRNHRILDSETGEAIEPDFSTQSQITEFRDKVLEYLGEDAS